MPPLIAVAVQEWGRLWAPFQTSLPVTVADPPEPVMVTLPLQPKIPQVRTATPCNDEHVIVPAPTPVASSILSVDERPWE